MSCGDEEMPWSEEPDDKELHGAIYIQNKFASSNPSIALFSQRVLFREEYLRELAQLVIRSGGFNWRGKYRLKPHGRLSTTVVRFNCSIETNQNKIVASRCGNSFVFLDLL